MIMAASVTSIRNPEVPAFIPALTTATCEGWAFSLFEGAKMLARSPFAVDEAAAEVEVPEAA